MLTIPAIKSASKNSDFIAARVRLRQAIASAKPVVEFTEKAKAAILADGVYMTDPEHGESVRITDPERDWLMPMEKFEGYIAELEKRQAAGGFPSPGGGRCPALVAKTMVADAENVALNLMSGLMGIKKTGWYGEDRAKCLQLFEDLWNLKP